MPHATVFWLSPSLDIRFGFLNLEDLFLQFKKHLKYRKMFSVDFANSMNNDNLWLTVYVGWTFDRVALEKICQLMVDVRCWSGPSGSWTNGFTRSISGTSTRASSKNTNTFNRFRATTDLLKKFKNDSFKFKLKITAEYFTSWQSLCNTIVIRLSI